LLRESGRLFQDSFLKEKTASGPFLLLLEFAVRVNEFFE
jgi:hypothetical protein